MCIASYIILYMTQLLFSLYTHLLTNPDLTLTLISSLPFPTFQHQSSKDLEVLNEQRLEKVNRLKISEKERDNLSNSKIEAEVYIGIVLYIYVIYYVYACILQ